MARKIEKSIPWITMTFLFAIVFFGGAMIFKEVMADTNLGVVTVTVGNAGPSCGTVLFNGGVSGATPIALTEGGVSNAYVSVSASSTITDTNGYGDIKYATASLYHSATTCGASNYDNNFWCYYIASTTGSGCATSSCSGNSCVLTCSWNVWYTAIPTDASSSPYAANHWVADLKVMDGSNASATCNATNELSVSSYSQFTSSWSYLCGGGNCSPAQTSSQVYTNATNTGNYQINLEMSGVDFRVGAAGATMTSAAQKFATESNMGDWNTGTVLTNVATRWQIYIAKPLSTSTANSTATVNWQIKIPAVQAPGAYSGTNTISGIWTN
jgi:hypothetical protein